MASKKAVFLRVLGGYVLIHKDGLENRITNINKAMAAIESIETTPTSSQG